MHVGLQAARQRRLYGDKSMGLGIPKKKNYNDKMQKCQVKITLGYSLSRVFFPLPLFMDIFALTLSEKTKWGRKKTTSRSTSCQPP